jgi:hypothetical protein
LEHWLQHTPLFRTMARQRGGPDAQDWARRLVDDLLADQLLFSQDDCLLLHAPR